MKSEKLKTVTVTFHRARNYGAVLQAYALQKILLSLGYDNKILDESEEPLFKINKENIRLFFISCLLNIYTLCNLKKMIRQKKVFKFFVEENMQLTRKYDANSLKENYPTADIYITGSDQVFSYTIDPEKRDVRFLNFLKNEKKCSYAASFGEYDLSSENRKAFKENLLSFDQLSLREQKGYEYIKSFCDIKAEVNIDPIFLLTVEEWRKISVTPKLKEKYICCFLINNHPLLEDVISKLKADTKLKVICIQTRPMKILKSGITIINASPQEFLGYLLNAEYIITTSFHGTAFSILFNKQFYTLIKNFRPQRMENLFSLFNINSSHLIRDNFTFDNNLIDYAEINKKIENERSKAFSYLKSFKNL